MKKMTLLLAIATMLSSSLGCGFCRNMFTGKTHVVARPACSPCGSSQCGSICAPGCKSCGNPVPTGFNGIPTTTTMAPGDYSGTPVMMTVPTEVPTDG